MSTSAETMDELAVALDDADEEWIENFLEADGFAAVWDVFSLVNSKVAFLASCEQGIFLMVV